ncbi:type II secretion system protein [Clostridium tagluense]|uniref:type II secretion system protein n=1 Tax=Clostridium tagluense TaxID=360422 RepID=UPI001C0DDB5C|nr:type II secretion system protein [Clostridium tagluense]MBU3126588.1 type II secretion system GspH family protein [Clostridium tagluense]MCB2297107.1 type II secretion system GspH family protein [Clostridium tagluense]
MRKGFTLIEMVLVIAIMSMIAGCSVISLRFHKSVKNKVDLDYYCNATVGFINNSKMYCRENSCSAKITFDIGKNEMNLENDRNTVKTLAFTKGITLYKVQGRRINGKIEIDKDGFSNDACTIILKDNNSIEQEITMRVGTSYVKINK